MLHPSRVLSFHHCKQEGNRRESASAPQVTKSNVKQSSKSNWSQTSSPVQLRIHCVTPIYERRISSSTITTRLWLSLTGHMHILSLLSVCAAFPEVGLLHLRQGFPELDQSGWKVYCLGSLK